MQGTILQLILHASLVVKVVLVVLAFFSILSWSIIFAKYYHLKAAYDESAAFAKAVEASRDPKVLLEAAKSLPHSPLANAFTAAHHEQSRLHRDDGRRVFDRHAVREGERLHASTIVLATTGATAPFIGLLGTVWGIMDAFRGIGAAGSASLAVVAPAIAEALITTAAGLAVAIPAVMAYNYYVNWIRRMTVEFEGVSDALEELVSKRAA